jgi:hypothetical protein
MDQSAVKNRRITISERIGQLLEVMTIGIGGEITLNKIMEFTLQMNNTTRLVSCEKAAEMDPNLASSRALELKTHIHHILRYSGIEPIADKKVLFSPLKIRGKSGIRFDMRKEIEPAENHLEQGAPLGVIVGLYVQGIWNQRLDVDVVDGLRHGNTRRSVRGVTDERTRGQVRWCTGRCSIEIAGGWHHRRHGDES